MELSEAIRKLNLGEPHVAYVSIDTEGTSRTGLKQVAAVLLDDPDTFFFDTVTRGDTSGLAPSDARRTWAHVGPRFWKWLSNQGDKVVIVGHNVRAHDMPLLTKETKAACPQALEGIKGKFFVCDTLEATRKLVPMEELRDRRQHSVYRHLFGGEPLQRHTALGDARANAAIATHERFEAYVKKESSWVKF